MVVEGGNTSRPAPLFVNEFVPVTEVQGGFELAVTLPLDGGRLWVAAS